MASEVTLDRLQAAQLTVAHLIEKDEIYLPIFERLEREIAALERPEPSALERARALAAQSRSA